MVVVSGVCVGVSVDIGIGIGIVGSAGSDSGGVGVFAVVWLSACFFLCCGFCSPSPSMTAFFVLLACSVRQIISLLPS